MPALVPQASITFYIVHSSVTSDVLLNSVNNQLDIFFPGANITVNTTAGTALVASDTYNILIGVAVPAKYTGSNNDRYIQTTTMAVYEKLNDSWQSAGVLTGLQLSADALYAVSNPALNTQVLHNTASAATPVILTGDGQAASNYNVFNIADNTAEFITVQLIARDVTNTAKLYAASWIQNHVLARVSGAASVLLDNVTTTIVPDYTRSVGTLTGLACTIAADTVNGGIIISFTPPTGNTDTWHITAYVSGVQVS